MIAGIFFILCEIFLPGGIIGMIGCLFVSAAIVIAFTHDVALGVYLLVGSILFGAVGFWAWLKYLPKIPGANRIFHNDDAAEWSGTDKKNPSLLGKEGKTQTVLRPSGFAMIDGERVDVVTEGGMIEEDRKVKVIEVEGNRIVVAELDADV